MAETSTARASGSQPPAVSEDRLSSLPDALLHTIMSFLTARQAVQMSVLSRRWVDLWCSMPCLEIDRREFKAPEWIEHDREKHEARRFVNFVDNLLTFHRAPSLDTLRFYISNVDGLSYLPLDRWLRRFIKFCPEVMEICNITYEPNDELPHLGSSSRRLKRLHLVGLYLDKNFSLQLRSGCLVLEDLVLEHCLIAYPEIMSSTLKNLVIVDGSKTHWGNTLTVTAPALASLHLDTIPVGWCWNGVLVNELPSLVKASFSFRYHPCTGRFKHEGPWKLLSSLINVRHLELSGQDTLLVFLEELDAIPTFSNLRTLLFEECELTDNLLDCFLKKAPSLTKLTLKYYQLPKGSRKRIRTTNPKSASKKCQEAAAFHCPNLKSTEIKYKADDAEQLFSLLSGTWRSLQKSTITLTRA